MFVHHFKMRPPQLLPAWIERHCVRRTASHNGVVSIVAGPGYGKTVLAAQVFAAWTGPKLWYGLDAADCDLAVFATHFDTVLRSLGRATRLQGESWRLGSSKELASLFAAAFEDLAQPALLIFDDVHLIENSRSLEVLSDVIGRVMQVGATVFICGRSMPLALHAYAAAGRLMRVGSAELAFDEAESRRYLRSSTRDVRDERATDELIRLAEGWPAGLALVGSSGVSADQTASLATHVGGEEARQLLFDYLAAEVLEALDDRERRFLLETSILDDLEAGLCAEIAGLGEAAEILRSFAARGFFITRRSELAYGAHRLFRDFLRAELARSLPEDVTRLQRAAADAYRRRGDYVSALRHRLLAGDLDEAVCELEHKAFALIASGVISPLRAFLARVGRERTEASPTLLAAQGRLQQIRGEWDDALVSLERAMRAATERSDYAVLAEGARAVAPILASRGEFTKLDTLLARTLALPIPEANRIALLSTQSAVYVETERYDDAVRLFAEIMPTIVARGDLAMQGMVLHNTGAAHVRRGDPYAGLAFYERALRVKNSGGQRVSALVTLANQIFALVLIGETDDANRLVAHLLAEAADLDNATMLAYGHKHLGEIALARGDLPAAVAAYHKARSLCDPGDVLVLPEILHGYARALLESHEPELADELCAQAIKLMRAALRSQPIAPVLSTRASCAFARAEHDRGVAFVEESLELAKAGDDALLRTYVNLDAAAALVRATSDVHSVAKRVRLDELAETATATAVALMEQRDYRFLLRTKAAAFATLHESRLRWAKGRDASTGAEASADALRIEMLGGLRVSVRGEAVPAKAWTRRKARDLFAHLVTLQGRLCSRARLVDLYWPEVEGDTAHDLLRVTVSAIRKAVGNVIRYEEGGYRFVAPAGTAVDVEVFERHIEAARAAEAGGAVVAARAAFLRAVQTYRGDFLEGAEDAAWLWRERERLRKPYLAALRWLVRHPSDDFERSVALLDRLLEETPFDVEAVKLRLDVMTKDMRTLDATLEYARWKSAYRATVGAEAPEIWQPPVLANC
jgi:ATP/maltotriose-dependent transcriptional regulator MalT/DNA-binding SARP family transcriptional activator